MKMVLPEYSVYTVLYKYFSDTIMIMMRNYKIYIYTNEYDLKILTDHTFPMNKCYWILIVHNYSAILK
jgi:hypothetical protein